MNEKSQASTKTTFAVVISWIFGSFFMLMGIATIFLQVLPGIIALVVGSFLLPPTSKLIEKKGKFHLSSLIKVIIGFVGFILFGASYNTADLPTTIPSQTNQTSTTQENEKDTKAVVVGFGNGTHIVGTDIQPGTYRSQSTRMCYWARLKGFGGQLGDIIGNGNNSPEIVTISASDAAFETTCGKWVLLENTYPTTPATSFENGTYEVGKHIEAGTYRADQSPDVLCYWARLSSFSHGGVGGIITNGNSPTVIQISTNDKGFTTFGCGKWTKI